MAALNRSTSPTSAHKFSSSRRLPKSSEFGDHDTRADWTAARCHRLLRQLQSRLASLRRLTAEAHEGASQRSKRVAPTDDSEGRRDIKRIRHTYSKRRQKAASSAKHSEATTAPKASRILGTLRIAHKAALAEHTVFPVPDWQQTRDFTQACDTAVGQCVTKVKKTSSLALKELFAEVRSLDPGTLCGSNRTYEAILDWLVNLLESTQVKDTTPHRKSMLGLCLRQVPRCIAAIEEWDRQQSEEKREASQWCVSEASLSIYSQLEALGTAGRGWQPIKMVVRSHGIGLLANAVSEGLVDTRFLSVLTRVCVQLQCHEEAAKLASAVTWVLPPPRDILVHGSTAQESTPQLLQIIIATVGDRNARASVFGYLSALIAEGRLFQGWLTSKAFSNVWASCSSALMGSGPEPRAQEFMITTITWLAHTIAHGGSIEDEGPEQFLGNLVASMVASAAAPGVGKDDGEQTEGRPRASRRLLHLLDKCVAHIHLQHRPMGGHKSSLIILTMARYLIVAHASALGDSKMRILARQMKQELECLIAPASETADVQYYQTVHLAASITLHRTRSHTSSTMETITTICGFLYAPAVPDWFTRGLQTDIAFLVAQKTKNLRDLASAESLSAASKLTGASVIFSGWRWEEGISEWVLPSPVQQRRKTKRRHVVEPGHGTDSTDDIDSFRLKIQARPGIQGRMAANSRSKAGRQKGETQPEKPRAIYFGQPGADMSVTIKIVGECCSERDEADTAVRQDEKSPEEPLSSVTKIKHDACTALDDPACGSGHLSALKRVDSAKQGKECSMVRAETSSVLGNLRASRSPGAGVYAVAHAGRSRGRGHRLSGIPGLPGLLTSLESRCSRNHRPAVRVAGGRQR